jgi:hypothetical protein
MSQPAVSSRGSRGRAEAVFLKQLEVGAETIGGKGSLAAADQDRHEEELVRVDQPSGDRLSRNLGTAHPGVAGR